MDWIYNDGGGPKDGQHCMPRAIAIVAQLDYDDVHEQIAARAENVHNEDGSTWAEAHGYYEGDDVVSECGAPEEAGADYLTELGYTWHRCGLGDDPIPLTGRLIVVMPGHFTALIDGVVHDTWDCRGRPIEGYWVEEA